LAVDTVVDRSGLGDTLAELETKLSFHDQFVTLFNADFPRVFRYLDRLSGEPDLAADLAQEAFVRLYRRGALPDQPRAWLVSVAMNLFRNVRTSESRRRHLLTPARGQASHSEAPPSPAEGAEAAEIRCRVRAALDRMPERERHLLLLRAEGYSYRDLAQTLALNEASIGVLLARARTAFRVTYGDAPDER
jgi:RNA polymerase sigma-70 factor (ECF subfamily)